MMRCPKCQGEVLNDGLAPTASMCKDELPVRPCPSCARKDAALREQRESTSVMGKAAATLGAKVQILQRALDEIEAGCVAMQAEVMLRSTAHDILAICDSARAALAEAAPSASVAEPAKHVWGLSGNVRIMPKPEPEHDDACEATPYGCGCRDRRLAAAGEARVCSGCGESEATHETYYGEPSYQRQDSDDGHTSPDRCGEWVPAPPAAPEPER